ncbi:GNAT family N-acetyltransferase [Isoptericola sp. BMS4]|uniref:GNAT family N-acetyltransferase n=1 Tax=Isoptericola sp. BMS4 TaxID=2527875 RepID=UPI0014218006|nr:GNAT family N-acetyltransferase [Isoptericola sp. BMS4]
MSDASGTDATGPAEATTESTDQSDLTTRVALVDDAHAGELLTLRRAAFVSEAQLYDDPHIPPLTQTLHELRDDMARDDVVTVGAWEGHRLVGSLRLEIEGGKATLGRLAVAPDQEGRGIGTSLMFAILNYLPEQVTEIWAFTGKDSKKNLAMYTKHGYEEQYDRAAGKLTLTYLRRVLGEVDARGGASHGDPAASVPAGDDAR